MNTSEGPWMVCMFRDDFGTAFRIMEHIETAVRINPEDYYSSDYKVPVDKNGYFMPDKNIDCSEHHLANAHLIAAAPDLLAALRLALDGLDVYAPDYMHGLPKSHYIRAARAAIAKAEFKNEPR